MKSRYADTLNALDEMQQSIAYAARRPVLAEAERIIVYVEQRCKRLESVLHRIADLDYSTSGAAYDAHLMACYLLGISRPPLTEEARQRQAWEGDPANPANH